MLKLFWSSKYRAHRAIINRKALPMGRSEFQKWAAHIIMLANIPGATAESQAFTLANLLLHLGPTESHKEDAFFVHSLRKFAVNQVADVIRVEIRDAVKARLAADETAKMEKALNGAATHITNTDENKVLANQCI